MPHTHMDYMPGHGIWEYLTLSNKIYIYIIKNYLIWYDKLYYADVLSLMMCNIHMYLPATITIYVNKTC